MAPFDPLYWHMDLGNEKTRTLFNLSRPEGIMEMIIMCQERFPPDSIFWLYLKILGIIMSNSIKLSS